MSQPTQFRITALHGMLGSPEDWNPICERLSIFHSWEIPDLFSDDWDVDLKQFGARLNQQSSGDILLGYSMGGRLALHALVDDPSRWKAVIIVSANPGLEEAERPDRLAADLNWADKLRNEDWQSFLETWNAQAVFGGSAKTPNRDHLKDKKGHIANAFDKWSLGRQEDLTTSLATVETPILWITGELDQKFCAIAEQTAAQINNGSWLSIPNAAHRVPWENTDAFCDCVSDFLEKISAP